jgi:hypothetical protein
MPFAQNNSCQINILYVKNEYRVQEQMEKTLEEQQERLSGKGNRQCRKMINMREK